MKELTGNLWRYYNAPQHIICITTNGFVKKDGTAVMGRGCANEARFRIPGIATELGKRIRAEGNKPCWLYHNVISFPVKHAWYEPADLALIRTSARWLGAAARAHQEFSFILPRPGCGNGKLSYCDVKPILVDLLPDNVYVIDFGEPA